MSPSSFAPVRVILAREHDRGRAFPEAWELALEALPAEEHTAEALERRQAREALRGTRGAWREAYKRRPAKVPLAA